MKYIVALLVLVAGISAEKCSEEEAEACLRSVIASALSDDSDEETCRELQNSVNCLRDTINDCPGQAVEVVETLQLLENRLEENCKTEVAVSVEEAKQCWTEDEEEYVTECVMQAVSQALDLAIENNNLDKDDFYCSMYTLSMKCAKKKVTEKCGEAAGRLYIEEIDNVPVEIVNACEKSGGFASNLLQLLEDKRKK